MDTNQFDRLVSDPSDSPAPVTVLGLGLMGQALATAFLAGGHPTTVWNRSAAKADPLVAKGATLAGSVTDAVAASPLVVICVSDYEAVHEIVDPLGELLVDRVLVNLSSSSSQQARDTAEWATRQGYTYLDGAVLAIPTAIGTADAVVIYSGPQSAFEQHEPTLRSLAMGTAYLGEDHGLSSLYDTAVLSLMWNVLNGFLHGAALLGAAKVAAATFAPFAGQLVVGMTGWLTAYAEQIDGGRYPALDSSIETHRKAMEHLVHESESLGVDVELPRFVKSLVDRAVADGHGGDGYAAIIEQFRR